MAKTKSPNKRARRPWFAWLELQYRCGTQVLEYTQSDDLEAVPENIRELRHEELKLIVAIFYNDLANESAAAISDRPLFWSLAQSPVDIDKVKWSIGTAREPPESVSKSTWNSDRDGLNRAILRARKWFCRHDREPETADSKIGKACKAGAIVGGKKKRIPIRDKMRIARMYKAELETLMEENPNLLRTVATNKVGVKHKRSGRHVREYLRLLR